MQNHQRGQGHSWSEIINAVIRHGAPWPFRWSMVHLPLYGPSSCPSSCANLQKSERRCLEYHKHYHVGTSSYTFLCPRKELLCHIKGRVNTLTAVPTCSKMSFKWSLKCYTFIFIKLCMYMMDDLLVRMTMAFKCLFLYLGL